MSYENLSVAELREMCARLRITPGRSKAETITRVEAEDRREAEAADAAASAIVVNGDVLPADSEEAQIILHDPLPEIVGTARRPSRASSPRRRRSSTATCAARCARPRAGRNGVPRDALA